VHNAGLPALRGVMPDKVHYASPSNPDNPVVNGDSAEHI